MWCKQDTKRNAKGGFTLVELLLVVTILGILAAIVTMRVVGISDETRREATRVSIRNISTTIEGFEVTKSRLPDSLEELTVDSPERPAPLDKRNLNDAWGHPFQYRKIDKFHFDVRSAGLDGQMGTDDDLTNTGTS